MNSTFRMAALALAVTAAIGGPATALATEVAPYFEAWAYWGGYSPTR